MPSGGGNSSGGGTSGGSEGGSSRAPFDRDFYEQPEYRGDGSSTRITGDFAEPFSWLRAQYPHVYDFVALAKRNREFPCYCGIHDNQVMLFRMGEKNALKAVKKPAGCNDDPCVTSECQKNYSQELSSLCENHWFFYKKESGNVR